VIAQTLAWQGLMAMQRVWAETGHTTLARQARVWDGCPPGPRARDRRDRDGGESVV
jgi:hypothetical protein